MAEKHKVVKIKSRWNTSHECESCDKRFCGNMAALVELDNGDDRIICAECVKKVKAGLYL